MSSATELRHDPLSGRLVIVAAGRAARPHTVAPDAPDAPDAHDAPDAPGAGSGPDRCAFCPGHEAQTPPEVARTGAGEPGTPGWRVRVVPNLYPIVGGETVGDVAVGAGGGVVPATGTHEVVVLSPNHHRSFAALDDGEAVEVVGVLRDRVAAHLRAGHRYAIALMNHGRAAGASIAHPHAQVVALDFVPPEVVAADRRAVDAGVDLIASDLADARAHGSVLSEQGARSWFPYAGGGPFVARVADPTAGHRFDLAADDLLARVALALRDTLAQLRATLGDPAYNVTVHTAAADDTGPRRWYVEVTPRLGVVAGFEMATGVLVSTTPAEHAAALVRAACPGAHPR